MDFPDRKRPASGITTWIAEMALVCTYDSKIGVIGSFLWGFDIGDTGNPNAIGPRPWVLPSNAFMNALTNSPSASGWSSEVGNCCTPEPLSV